MTISYDHRADVLYVTFEKRPADSFVYVENAEGDILRLDKETKRVIGFTIPDFSKRTVHAEKVVVPEVTTVPFNEQTEELLTV